MSGTIDSSLFGAVNSAGGSDGLAVALADVFKYDIDFVNEVQPRDPCALAGLTYQHGRFEPRPATSQVREDMPPLVSTPRSWAELIAPSRISCW